MVNEYLRQRCYTFSTMGRVVYDPDRKGMKSNTDYWAVIEIDNGIADYYRHLFFRQYGIRLDKTAWDAHISMLKNYTQTNKDIPWKYRDNEWVEVQYTHDFFWNDDHVWINCHTDIFYEIRDHYGITMSKDRGHITIGKFNDKDKHRIPKLPF